MSPMLLRAGTSGFSYKEWKGPFYPADLSNDEMLRFYASRLPAVEINNTFYRLPRASVLEAWAAQVPPEFRFAIKASRRITHFKRLKDAGEPTEYLLGVTRALGERLGAILFQLPPNFRLDLPRLDSFLALLPEGTRAAFEFRHPSWREPAVHERLAARDFAWVVADGVDDDDGSDATEAPAELVRTARWSYLRLRRPGYARADLTDWARRLDACGLEDALVFFKHEDEGAGPRLAAEFLELAGPALARGRPEGQHITPPEQARS